MIALGNRGEKQTSGTLLSKAIAYSIVRVDGIEPWETANMFKTYPITENMLGRTVFTYMSSYVNLVDIACLGCTGRPPPPYPIPPHPRPRNPNVKYTQMTWNVGDNHVR